MTMTMNDAALSLCHACEQWVGTEFTTQIAGDSICEACEEIVEEQLWNDFYEQEDRWGLAQSIIAA